MTGSSKRSEMTDSSSKEQNGGSVGSLLMLILNLAKGYNPTALKPLIARLVSRAEDFQLRQSSFQLSAPRRHIGKSVFGPK